MSEPQPCVPPLCAGAQALPRGHRCARPGPRRCQEQRRGGAPDAAHGRAGGRGLGLWARGLGLMARSCRWVDSAELVPCRAHSSAARAGRPACLRAPCYVFSGWLSLLTARAGHGLQGTWHRAACVPTNHQRTYSNANLHPSHPAGRAGGRDAPHRRGIRGRVYPGGGQHAAPLCAVLRCAALPCPALPCPGVQFHH